MSILRKLFFVTTVMFGVIGLSSCSHHHGHHDGHHNGHNNGSGHHGDHSIHGHHGSTNLNTGILYITKYAPETAAYGNPYDIDFRVKALESCKNIVITEKLEHGLEYVSSEPAASLEGNSIVWRFDKMHAHDEMDLKLTVRPIAEGDAESCLTATAIENACTLTHVGSAMLAITKSGPERALLGERISYLVNVKNIGTMTAENVMLMDNVPSGFNHSSGDKTLNFDLGDLDPNEEVSVNVPMSADSKGVFTNQATASADNAGAVSDTAITQVVVKTIAIDKSGPDSQFVGKPARYAIVVTNTGDEGLSNVRVTDTIPSGTRILDAGGANVSGRNLSWNVSSLGAGQSDTFYITLTSDSVGVKSNGASVSAESLNASDDAATEWIGHPALLIEVVDTNDPLLVGEKTTYPIRVTNQGTAIDKDVQIRVMLSDELRITGNSGATSGTQRGNMVIFDKYSEIAPGQTIQFTIEAEAIREGDGRIRVDMSSDLLRDPVTEIESTQIY